MLKELLGIIKNMSQSDPEEELSAIFIGSSRFDRKGVKNDKTQKTETNEESSVIVGTTRNTNVITDEERERRRIKRLEKEEDEKHERKIDKKIKKATETLLSGEGLEEIQEKFEGKEEEMEEIFADIKSNKNVSSRAEQLMSNNQQLRDIRKLPKSKIREMKKNSNRLMAMSRAKTQQNRIKIVKIGTDRKSRPLDIKKDEFEEEIVKNMKALDTDGQRIYYSDRGAANRRAKKIISSIDPNEKASGVIYICSLTDGEIGPITKEEVDNKWK